MRDKPIDSFQSGKPFNVGELERAFSIVGRTSGARLPNTADTSAGMFQRPDAPPFVYAQIVSVDTSVKPARHEWMELLQQEDGTFAPMPAGIYCGICQCPAYALNDTIVAPGTVVQMYPTLFDVWVFKSDCCPSRSATSGGYPNSTTTTMIPCAGSCRWDWVASTQSWSLASNTCAQGTTTSSTTTTPHGYTTTSTTTTTSPPICPRQQTTTGNPNTTTPTPTTTTPPPCNCFPPSYCGGLNCEHTTTRCGHNAAGHPPVCCSTTTTTTAPPTTTPPGTTLPPTTTTSTTTTLNPGCTTCSFYCNPATFTWVPLFNGCSSTNCACPFSPTSCGPASLCSTIGFPCQTTPPPPPPPPPPVCLGQCEWVCGIDGIWYRVLDFRYQCTSLAFGCNCEPPPSPLCNKCGDVTFTGCSFPLPPPTTTSTTPIGTTTSTTTLVPTTTPTPTTTTTTCIPTTTTQAGCLGNCTWVWNTTFSQWTSLTSCGASNCGCPYPPIDPGSTSCDTAQTPCGPTTTSSTTTSTTSSTTSTTTTSCGTCAWLYQAVVGWTQVSNFCVASCPTCSSPDFVGTPGQTATTYCTPTTTTTTTTTSTTTTCNPTTTPAPGACGTCLWIWHCPPPGLLCDPCAQVVQSNCTGGCACGTPSAPCCTPPNTGKDTYITVNCVATTTTTAPCFVTGTLVLTADGDFVTIESVLPGQLLRSFNYDSSLSSSYVAELKRAVSNTVRRIQTTLVSVDVSAEHPLYVGDGRFVDAGQLDVGDTLYTWDGTLLVPSTLTSIVPLPGDHEVWNLLMAGGPPTFIAGGVAVHNKGG